MICQYFDGGEDMIASAEAMRLRSTRYLFARGCGTNPAMDAALAGLSSMRKAAEQDTTACGNMEQACMETCNQRNPMDSECREHCISDSQMQFPICAQVAQKVARCWQVDALP